MGAAATLSTGIGKQPRALGVPAARGVVQRGPPVVVRRGVIGAAAEQGVLADINSHCPAALNLCGRTDFGQIAALARGAVAAVGNDTGPMHIVASVGCPATVIFSAASDPDLTAPRGARVRLLQCDRMVDLAVDEVRASLTLP